MLEIKNLNNLKKHFKYLEQKINKKDFFVVGGTIRDMLLGINSNPTDIDITLAGKPEEVYKDIDSTNTSIFKTDKFGTITIIPKDNKEYNYEITPLREEGDYMDFRRPNYINWSDSIISDSKRRDFTINCIYGIYITRSYESDNNKDSNYFTNEEEFTSDLIDYLEENKILYFKSLSILVLQDQELIEKVFSGGELDESQLGKIIGSYREVFVLIDPWQGISDLLKRKLRAVGNPDDRFQEDALRIIRAARLVNILNQYKISKRFDFEKETRGGMLRNYFLVQFLAKERIKDEINKVFENNDPFGFMVITNTLNIDQYIFPSLEKMKNNHQPTRFHAFDTYTHTMLALYYFQIINSDKLAKLGVLFHDIGKPDQYYYVTHTQNKDQKVYHTGFIHHPQIGGHITQKDLEQMAFSKNEIREIRFYVEYHFLPGDILSSKEENIEKKLTKAISEHGYTQMMNLIDICIADRLGQFNPMQSPEVDELNNMKNLLYDIYQKQGQFSMKDMDITGEDIMNYFGISPGPKIGELKNLAFDWVVEDVENRNFKNLILEYLEDFYSQS